MGCSCSQGKVWVGGIYEVCVGSCSRRKLQVCFNLLAKCGEELQNLARSVADDEEYDEEEEEDEEDKENVEDADSEEVAVAEEASLPTCGAADALSGMKGCKQLPLEGRKAPIRWSTAIANAASGRVPVPMGGKKAALLRAAGVL